jgi:hypothetical protein
MVHPPTFACRVRRPIARRGDDIPASEPLFSLARRTPVTVALLLSGLLIVTAQGEDTAVSKRSAYPQLQAKPSTGNKPAMTAADQEKLKRELNDAAARAKAKKP